MNAPVAPSFDAVESVLVTAGVTAGAAESHGSFCGFACLLGAAARIPWLAHIMDAAREPDTAATNTVLDSLAQATCIALEEGDMSFQPLLLPDAEPLADRTQELADWCQGFTAGLATAAGMEGIQAVLTEGTTGEIVSDFSELALVTVDGDDGDEAESEAAYMELVEYVRVSVQLLYEELSPVRRRTTPPDVH